MGDSPRFPEVGALLDVPGVVVIRTLGRAEVRLKGQPVVWPARSAEELLWYLHAHPEGRYRHDILTQLWELDDTPGSANRFRVALHRLRTTLGRADAVVELKGRYALHPDLYQASDTYRLHLALSASRLVLSSGAQQQLLREVVELQGEYLPQLRGEWVEQARAQYQALLVQAQVQLSLLYCTSRNCHLAAHALTQAAGADPLIAEDHHQRLMACLATTRDKYAAIEHYRRYRQFLTREVGDSPMPETVQLAEYIKSGGQPCSPTTGSPLVFRPNSKV